MSFFSIGNSEIKNLINKEQKMKKELEKISKNSPAENVYDFKAIVLKNEIAKIHNKLQMLSKGTSPDDNTA